MARAETRILDLPTATEKRRDRTQIFHGLPVPIQPAARPALTVADFATDGPKTRLLPIEQLLQPAPKGATSATRGWQSRLHPALRRPMSRGRKLRLVVGLLSVVAMGYASLAEVRASTPRPARRHPIVAAARVTPAPVAAPIAVTAAAEVSRPVPRKTKRTPAEPTARRVEPSKGASARRAGDQLASGDLARAAKTYEQLAARAPADPVYAEAARILRLRVARPTP